jgi:hypothetical protein
MDNAAVHLRELNHAAACARAKSDQFESEGIPIGVEF